ncbi:MAG: AAA family ATPase [Candidatus Methanoplasma sp.]|jgi:dephospho-CoA kinase|nr:AAA family ATPase [Candidatus Methanoplasma sp.]
MKIIIISGMPGAGKEEFLSTAGAMGLPFVRMGDVVREFYSGSSDQERGSSVGEFANAERERFGKNIWAKRVIEKMSGGVFIIDGCRSMDEIRSFRELSDDVLMVGIHAPPEQRHERLVKRGRDDSPKNLEEFNKRDSREISWGLAEVIALSDVMIINASGLDEFHSAAADVLKRSI